MTKIHSSIRSQNNKSEKHKTWTTMTEKICKKEYFMLDIKRSCRNVHAKCKWQFVLSATRNYGIRSGYSIACNKRIWKRKANEFSYALRRRNFVIWGMGEVVWIWHAIEGFPCEATCVDRGEVLVEAACDAITSFSNYFHPFVVFLWQAFKKAH